MTGNCHSGGWGLGFRDWELGLRQDDKARGEKETGDKEVREIV